MVILEKEGLQGEMDHQVLGERMDPKALMVLLVLLDQKEHQDTKDQQVWLVFLGSEEFLEHKETRVLEVTLVQWEWKGLAENLVIVEPRVLLDLLVLLVRLEVLVTLVLQDLWENKVLLV